MVNRLLPWMLLTALSIAVPAPGQPADGQALTLDQCISIALEQNPRVLGSREQHRAALARVNLARALPQPVFSLDSDLQPRPFHFARSGERYVGITQAIEFPGKRAARGGMAIADAGQARTDTDLVRLDVTYEVTEAFNALLLAEERLKYAGDDRRLSQDFLSQTELKHEAGDVAQVEVLRARLEVAQAESTVRAATNEVALARARLNFLLARPEDAPLAVEGALKQPPVLLDLTELKGRALAARPELKRVQFAVDRERLRARQASLAYFPDFEVGFARHTLAGAEGSWDVTLALPVPLFFWQPRKGEIAEAEANVAAAGREAEHLRR
jgi:cobalt-zinc-cadmium efflux system outer membrane protein